MRNAIFYIESMEMLLADSEKYDADQEGILSNETGNSVLSESKKVDESVTSLTSSHPKKYQSELWRRIF